ncbi:SR1 protein [Salsuginibacillus halophilus]|uniref:SR1 protein n=1 Tax=Salsuginibacillus halophilus TaxID=517424 RepID=A0A2P8HXD4_9BACI|nr:GapA-binding peptide SR1P [Salsuginibacillus halophilus]PSL50844.1 SR1 protein [Salsuginibacillus halophilus]
METIVCRECDQTIDHVIGEKTATLYGTCSNCCGKAHTEQAKK